MNNIFDYLDWRGDINMTLDPFNHIDNVILSQLCYVNFDNFFQNGKKEYVLHELADLFFENNDEQALLISNEPTKHCPFVMKAMASKMRYRNIRVSHYVNIIDYEKEIQFSAMHFHLEDGTTYIAFRGTDDSLVGWKEDFNMTFLNEIPSQRAAAKYLIETVRFGFSKLIIGGHSKGGNLAIYASAKATKHIKNRIKTIYSNDGPGFLEPFADSAEYLSILPRIINIAPYSSVVGRLLCHKEKYLIVDSFGFGIDQHNVINWKLKGTRFYEMSSFDDNSNIFNQLLDNYLSSKSIQERKLVVDTVYALLVNNNINTFSEASRLSLKQITSILKEASSLDNETKALLIELFKLVIKAGNAIATNQIRTH